MHKTKNIEIVLCYPVKSIFNNLINGYTFKNENFILFDSKTIFFNKNKNIIFEHYLNYYEIWCSDKNFWKYFEINESFNYIIIRNLLRYFLEDFLNIEIKRVNSIYSL